MTELSVTIPRSIPTPAHGAHPHQHTIPTSRLVLAWTILLGGMIGFWFVRPLMTTVAWGKTTAIVLWVTSKFATLICMPPDDRRRLSWGRYLAYLFWPGMQPSHFLPERTPTRSQVAPTVRGMLLNAVAAVVFLWLLPALLPASWPQWFRVLSGKIGYAMLLLFAIFDAWALLYRAGGIGVEKLWHCPIAATSLVDFWGQRWNRIFSGMLREVLFLPLARRIGAGVALFAVFFYSGLLHENFSVTSLSGYGLPTLYFLIQGLGTWLENRRAFRRLLRQRPLLGRVWTAAVVLGPVLLLFHEGFREQYLMPSLARVGVPGVEWQKP